VTLRKISELLKAENQNPGCDLNIDIKHVKASDLMSDVLAFAESGALLVTGLTNNHVIRTCEIAGICAVVIVRNKIPTSETIQLSREKNIPIILTKMTMFEACGILYENGLRGIPAKTMPV
jgi:hypothetical protein